MNFPFDKDLPINKLASIFNKTSAAYKFYWFISILQALESGKSKITKIEIFSRMISNSWYTINYFNVSFGKQDLIPEVINSINLLETITIDEDQEAVYQKLLYTKNKDIQKHLWHFNNNVPHWFLSPWFPKIENENYTKRKKRIYYESSKFSSKCLYALHQEFIEINPDWLDYLTNNSRVLKDFCYWNLALFLQAKNPNVPDIPNKLIKPAKRNSLKTQRDNYWSKYLNEKKSTCIFTNELLNPNNYELDHFVPFSFVSHDLMWNLVPISKSFNSRKSNKLPDMKKHFKPFFNIQKDAFFTLNNQISKKVNQEYVQLFKKIESSEDFSYQLMKNTIGPLITLAKNNGFEEMN